MAITGWSHVALSVTDLDRSVAWYQEVLDLGVLFRFSTADFDRALLGHTGGVVVALTQHRATTADSFDPVRVGLDHLSWRVADESALVAWVEKLDGLGIHNGGVQRNPRLGSALVAFRDPDGIQLEVYVQTGSPSSS